MGVLSGEGIFENCAVTSRRRNRHAPTAATPNKFLLYPPGVVAIPPTHKENATVASSAA